MIFQSDNSEKPQSISRGSKPAPSPTYADLQVSDAFEESWPTDEHVYVAEPPAETKVAAHATSHEVLAGRPLGAWYDEQPSATTLAPKLPGKRQVGALQVSEAFEESWPFAEHAYVEIEPAAGTYGAMHVTLQLLPAARPFNMEASQVPGLTCSPKSAGKGHVTVKRKGVWLNVVLLPVEHPVACAMNR